jgi:hypothetical protein
MRRLKVMHAHVEKDLRMPVRAAYLPRNQRLLLQRAPAKGVRAHASARGDSVPVLDVDVKM